MPSANYLCFVISPIGPEGSQTRRDYDDLLELIIKPAMEVFPFDVRRGDHTQEPNQIHQDVVNMVQKAALCIADISEQNVNVYYEIGRRHETGKPLIYLKRKDSEEIAVDLGNPRYIEYDFDSRYGIRDTIIKLRAAIQPMLDQGMDIQSTGATLADISKRLGRIETKLLQISTGNRAASAISQVAPAADNDPFQTASPVEVFMVAAKQRNIQLVDMALDRLRYISDEVNFLDRYASVAASIGSDKGGSILIEKANWFVTEDSISFHKKIEYLGCLVSYLNRKDMELEYRDLIEEMCKTLLELTAGQSNKDIAQIFNQRNRLYHGIYSATEDIQWLQKAIDSLEQAKTYVPQAGYIYFNLATCYHSLEDYQSAKENIMIVIGIDGEKNDEDHLYLACKILDKLDEANTSEYQNIFNRLSQVSPMKAQLLLLANH